MGVRVVAGIFAVGGLILIGALLFGTFNSHPVYSGGECFPVAYKPDSQTIYEPGYQDEFWCTQVRTARLAGVAVLAIPTSILGAVALLYRDRDA